MIRKLFTEIRTVITKRIEDHKKEKEQREIELGWQVFHRGI